IADRFSGLYRLLANKYYFDEFYEDGVASGARAVGDVAWRVGDQLLIDGTLVNGTARSVGWVSGMVRRMQSGYLYTYAFTMIIGLALVIAWFVFRN
ncbi:MAG: NADH-quinone oxidoreductase subunit L, partial [Gammaproteobacteria bacterium]